MDLTLTLKAILLGLLEGATEFIPVSSTGHLILAKELMGIGEMSNIFEVVIQAGSIAAVCLLYFTKLWQTFIGLGKSTEARRFVAMILAGFMPAALIGVVLHDYIKTVLFSPLVVSISLIVGGLIILLIERVHITPTTKTVDDILLPLALKVGFIQCLAMIPGISRSGATIMGAMVLGVERKAAAEFSFYLAIPTLLGAAALDLGKGWNTLRADDWQMIAVGLITSFIAAAIVIKLFIAYISRHSFVPFAWYRIGFGLVMLWLFWPRG
jgi:undecaprenyl-diphosphatase